jgi:hypothetical protein
MDRPAAALTMLDVAELVAFSRTRLELRRVGEQRKRHAAPTASTTGHHRRHGNARSAKMPVKMVISSRKIWSNVMGPPRR